MLIGYARVSTDDALLHHSNHLADFGLCMCRLLNSHRLGHSSSGQPIQHLTLDDGLDPLMVESSGRQVGSEHALEPRHRVLCKALPGATP